jgi:hypothetical protein
MATDAMIDQKKNFLWAYQQAEEHLAHAKEKVIRLPKLVEALQKWLATCGDIRINMKAEHKKLDEAIRSKAQTYRDIFKLSLLTVNEVGQYEKEVNDLAAKKTALGLR